MRAALRPFLLGLYVGLGLMCVLVVWDTVRAAAHTLTYSAGQDTAIQNTVIPIYNRAQCADFGLSASCTSAQLVSAGCTVRTIQTLVVRSCTSFPSTLAGQDAYLLEAANRAIISDYDKRAAFGIVDFKNAFATANQTARDNACIALGLPAGCPGP